MLPSPEVHVWEVDLAKAGWDEHRHILDFEENTRFGNIQLEEAAAVQCRCRVALRLLLSRYLGADPAAIRLCYGPYGKPGLPGGALKFSVSHSRNRGIIAVAGQDVGIDLECLDGHQTNIERLLDMICHDTEHDNTQSFPLPARRELFFQLWTRKEAYCKATGLGLYKAMNSFAIREDANGMIVDDPEAAAGPRHLVDLPSQPGWMACLCSPWRWPDLRLRAAEPNLAGI